MRSRGSLAVLSLLLLSPFSTAQSRSQQPSPPYTIQTISRVVLTDVTVTDSKGNPGHGLPQSAFQIVDNGKPQTISSFEEHSVSPTAVTLDSQSTPKGV